MSTLPAEVKSIFAEDGPLSRRAGFEYRPQQAAMAGAIADALERCAHLIVEAPTGVGKSLAYLVPAVLFALREKRKAIVSTFTKNLQEQILQKDIPIVRSLIGSEFSAVILKGRKNYLCTTRLRYALGQSGMLFDDHGNEELRRIYEWSRTTPDGDREHLPFEPSPVVWDLVCSEPESCTPSVCGSACSYQKLKERVRGADVVIMNHALFFTLLPMEAAPEGRSKFIFQDDFVIFDEAHTLEAVATAGIGKKMSRYQVLAALHKLYNERTKRGLLGKKRKPLRDLCLGVEQAATEFFESVRQAVVNSRTPSSGAEGSTPGAREIRVRTRHLVVNTLDAPLEQLHTAVQKLEEKLTKDVERHEYASVRRALWEAQVLVNEFLEQSQPGFTYWVELSGARGDNVTLCAAPMDLADVLSAKLLRSDTSVIMTSATLSVGNTLEYVQRRLGARHVPGMIIDSPFDYSRQMKLCVAQGIPEPDTEAYAAALPAWIMRSVERSRGKALVLFTSGALMRNVASAMADAFKERGFTLFVQGESLQRYRLLEKFKADIDSVLFGLDSFWMGIDVPGEALEHVIITRLPFAVPTHPLVESRLELIAQRGGNAFMEYTLPEAVLKFRQGVGRLLRTRTDKGLVTILDARLLTKRYGKVFFSSLPRSPVELLTAEGEMEYVPSDDW